MAATTLTAARLDTAPDVLTRIAASSGGGLRVATLPCLLVTRDLALETELTRAGGATGWKVVTHTEPVDAIRAAVLSDFPLSVVDLGANGQRFEGADNLLETLRGAADGLVIVCERVGAHSPEEVPRSNELWSRERGAWMYLPNTTNAGELEPICREARSVIDKLRGPLPRADAWPRADAGHVPRPTA